MNQFFYSAMSLDRIRSSTDYFATMNELFAKLASLIDILLRNCLVKQNSTKVLLHRIFSKISLVLYYVFVWPQVGAKYSDHRLGLHSLYTPDRSCSTQGNCHKQLHTLIYISRHFYSETRQPVMQTMLSSNTLLPSNTKIIFTFPPRDLKG